MTKQRLPAGWTPEKIRDVIELYETQTGAEAVAEMETAFADGRGYRTMRVPIEVEAKVLQIIADAEKAKPKHAGARRVAEKRDPYKP